MTHPILVIDHVTWHRSTLYFLHAKVIDSCIDIIVSRNFDGKLLLIALLDRFRGVLGGVMEFLVHVDGILRYVVCVCMIMIVI